MERAVEVPCEDEPLLYAALTSWHGWELSLLGRHAEADEVWQRGLAHAAESQNETARAYLLSKVGLSADDLGNHALALQCHEESVRLFEPMGNDAGLGYTFSRISWTQRMLGNTEEAITAAARGLEHFENVSHRWGIGVSYGRRGHAHLDAGHHGMAVRDFADCITWGAERQVPTITWYGLVGIALTLVEVDAALEAVGLLAHNVAIAQNPYAPGLAKPALDELEGRLDDDVFAEARRRGEAMSMEQAVAVAMGWVHRLQD